MSDRKVSPPPVLAPSVELSENFCLFHKGDIKGEIYTYPSCKTRYCLDCAEKAKKEENSV